MGRNNQLPTEQRNDFDIVHNIPISLKHIVRYKNGTAIYFLTRLYNNFNYGKNRIFINLLRVQTESNIRVENYFVEIYKTFGEKFDFLDFDIDIDDKLQIILNHDIVSQTKNVSSNLSEAVPLIDDNKCVETNLKNINDIEHWIEYERCRTHKLGDDDIVYKSGVVDMGCNTRLDIIPTQSMPFPKGEWRIDIINQKHKTILLRKNKNKKKFVRANVEKTILLK